MPKFIVKCPGCGRDVLTGHGGSPSALTAFTDKKECPGCKKGLKIEVKIEVTVDGPKKE